MFAPSALVLAFLSAVSLSQAAVLTVESTPGNVGKQCILVNGNVACPFQPLSGVYGATDIRAGIIYDGSQWKSYDHLWVNIPEQDTIQLNTELCLWGSSSGLIGCAERTNGDVVRDVPN
ncbi:hypothetical protein BDV95DRAFT_585539 [Massariosphaeria phaeospora]|uniref:Uncharacterized protein n=1 Tax=Massariosphaeria phaeospora TaxID=100035 RepID=A0A7C8M2T4_9PLEO|nr:hypothetical protein BDV95DRAFT_585539 [Massariosphaeria phaeospora]